MNLNDYEDEEYTDSAYADPAYNLANYRLRFRPNFELSRSSCGDELFLLAFGKDHLEISFRYRPNRSINLSVWLYSSEYVGPLD